MGHAYPERACCQLRGLTVSSTYFVTPWAAPDSFELPIGDARGNLEHALASGSLVAGCHRESGKCESEYESRGAQDGFVHGEIIPMKS
jgi:hypothetical protein